MTRFQRTFPILSFSCLILCLCCFTACQTEPATVEYPDPIAYVDPFIGTGFHGHTFPGATRPFGMVQLSPDTHLLGWEASSGYHYEDSTLYGFSHTHLSGTGIGDLGDILILPFSGRIEGKPVGVIDKAQESAGPGYYRVQLPNLGVEAELTATTRAGFHRYRFSDARDKKVMLDLGHILQSNWGHRNVSNELEILSDTTLQGLKRSSGWASDHYVYFYASFSRPFKVVEVFNEGAALPADRLKYQGKDLRITLDHSAADGTELLIKVGISAVSREGARRNLQAEIPDWQFDQVREAAENDWRQELSKIKVRAKAEATLTNFYTALYHTMVAPMIYQDTDGAYRGMDLQIRQAKGVNNYTVFSLWDTFRAQHPLMTIINEDRTNDWVKSLLIKYREGGLLPKWPLAANYTGTMVGYPAVAVIADAMKKNIGDFDRALALEAAVISSGYHPDRLAKIKGNRAEGVMPRHLYYLNKDGLIPADSTVGSVSYGVECAYYDWAIAQMAEMQDQPEIAREYLTRAGYYQKYFDPEFGFMRGKLASGQWKTPFNPRFSDHEAGEFIEGNAWQWSWFVPHDVQGLVKLMGGAAGFEAKLDSLFTTDSSIEGDRASSDITGLIGQYAHGNEPSHHIAYLYNYIGKGYKTQARVRQILEEMYQPTPAGIQGNEDCGQMSAWYVLSAMGFYPVTPGDGNYVVGSPILDEVSITLSNDKTLHIRTENNGPENQYIQSIRVNGASWPKAYLTHAELKAGGDLVFIMGPEPNFDWATAPENWPPSMSKIVGK